MGSFTIQGVFLHAPNKIMRIEKIRFFDGVASKKKIKEIYDDIEDNDDIVAILTDAAPNQLLSFLSCLLRLFCSCHTRFNAQSYLLDGGLFTFDNGRQLDVAASFDRLKQLHPELLNEYSVTFRWHNNLLRSAIQFAYCIRERHYQQLYELSQERLFDANGNINLDWESVNKYARFMLILEICHKSHFIDMNDEFRCQLLNKIIVRLESYNFSDPSRHFLTRMKTSLRQVVQMLKSYPPEHSTDLIFKSSLKLLETIGWRMKKQEINTIAGAREYFNFLSLGCYFLRLRGPLGNFGKVTCVPSIAPIE